MVGSFKNLVHILSCNRLIFCIQLKIISLNKLSIKITKDNQVDWKPWWKNCNNICGDKLNNITRCSNLYRETINPIMDLCSIYFNQCVEINGYTTQPFKTCNMNALLDKIRIEPYLCHISLWVILMGLSKSN